MAGDLDGRKFTLAYLITCAGGTVSWQSKLQKCVALSITQAEYTAPDEAAKEMLCLKMFVSDLGLSHLTYVIFCDSQSSVDLSKSPMYHSCTKHIDVMYHWSRSTIEDQLPQL